MSGMDLLLQAADWSDGVSLVSSSASSTSTSSNMSSSSTDNYYHQQELYSSFLLAKSHLCPGNNVRRSSSISSLPPKKRIRLDFDEKYTTPNNLMKKPFNDNEGDKPQPPRFVSLVHNAKPRKKHPMSRPFQTTPRSDTSISTLSMSVANSGKASSLISPNGGLASLPRCGSARSEAVTSDWTLKDVMQSRTTKDGSLLKLCSGEGVIEPNNRSSNEYTAANGSYSNKPMLKRTVSDTSGDRSALNQKKIDLPVKDADGNDVYMGYFSMPKSSVSAGTADQAVTATTTKLLLLYEAYLQALKLPVQDVSTAKSSTKPIIRTEPVAANRAPEHHAASVAEAKSLLYQAYLQALNSPVKTVV